MWRIHFKCKPLAHDNKVCHISYFCFLEIPKFEFGNFTVFNPCGVEFIFSKLENIFAFPIICQHCDGSIIWSDDCENICTSSYYICIIILEIWVISLCLGLCHGTMVCTVCLIRVSKSCQHHKCRSENKSMDPYNTCINVTNCYSGF